MNHQSFLLDLVNSLPEINGAFLFTPQTGILSQLIDDSIGNFDSLAIGKKMTGIAGKASDHFNDITHLQATFDNIILSGRLLSEEKWLFLLHKPELSSGMIRMALQLALNNSAQENDSPAMQPEPQVEKIAAAESPVTKEVIPVDIESLMAPGAPLAKFLNALQDELANCIGPAAIPVFQDVLTAWCQEYPPALNTLKHLIPLLNNEIDDSEDIKIFNNNIKDLFPQE
ncbi:MAG: hypothetical protein KJ990_12305 [Proteobacteria bacterium]|nr:hypothetical protein [Pseudomonadota bacterium]MBU1647938.1 hypothetical protein [Pseudomonadota bacterium]MBU1985788.1 hypothetical protein [Pseudomonadota bacterium]